MSAFALPKETDQAKYALKYTKKRDKNIPNIIDHSLKKN